MYRRKIQLVAGTTYSVSLPKEWVKKSKLKEKDEIVFHEKNDGSMVISACAPEEEKTNDIYLNIDEYIPIIDQILFAIYYQGIENITLFSRKKLTKEVRLRIRETLTYMSGTEITYEDKEKIKIKVLLDKSKVEVHQILYRIYLLIESSVLNLMEDLNIDEIAFNESEIDRLYHLMAKIVSVSLIDSNVLYSSKIRNISLIPSYFLISKKLENLADNVSHLSKYLYENRVVFESREEILKLILSELSRSIRHIAGKSSRVFERVDKEEFRKIDERIAKIPDKRIQKYLEDMVRYTLDVEDEIINISFHNQLGEKCGK